MKGLSLTLLIIFLSGYAVFCQGITPQVVNASGGTAKKGYYIVDWSVGEMALINLMQSGNAGSGYIITNGFIQPFTHHPSGIDNEYFFSDDEIRILPNPTRDIVEIDFRTKQKGHVRMQLLDIAGKAIYYKEFESFGDGHIERINMYHLAGGTYVLNTELLPQPGYVHKQGIYKILKIR
jgi:hypothetical protein